MRRSLLCLACAVFCVFFVSIASADEIQYAMNSISVHNHELYAADHRNLYRATAPNEWEVVYDGGIQSESFELIAWAENVLYCLKDQILFNDHGEESGIDYTLHRAFLEEDGSITMNPEVVKLYVPDVVHGFEDNYLFKEMFFLKDRLFILVYSDEHQGLSRQGPFDLWSVNPETGDVQVVREMTEFVDVYPAGDRLLVNDRDLQFVFYGLDGEKQEVRYKIDEKNDYGQRVSVYDQDTDTLYMTQKTELLSITGTEAHQKVGDYIPSSDRIGINYEAVICDGNMVVWDKQMNNKLFYTPLHKKGGSTLTISSMLYEDELNFLLTYQERHQDKKFQTVDMTWNDIAQMLNTRGDQLTVMGLNSMEGYTAIRDKAYFVDLAQDKNLAEAVARMAPFARNLVTDENGRIVALPYALYNKFSSFYFITYNQQVLTALGMTEADLPTTAGELVTMIEAWLQRDIPEDDEYHLFAQVFEGSSTLMYLRRMLLHLQAATCLQEGELVQFNTPVMRDLLARLDALEDVFEDYCGNELVPAQPERSLFTLWPSVVNEHRASYEHMLCLPLAIDDAHQPLLPMEMKLLAVNPYADEAAQQEALNLLSALATSFRPWNQVLFFPDANEPYTDPKHQEQAQKNLLIYQNMLSNKKDALEDCVDHEERTALEIEIADLEEAVADCINLRPDVSAEDIVAYRQVESAVYPLTYDWTASDTVWQLYVRYVQGNLTAEAFLKQVDGVLRMQQMEDQ